MKDPLQQNHESSEQSCSLPYDEQSHRHKRIAILKYNTENLGDDFQALAMEQLLPRVDLRVFRDDMTAASDWDNSVRFIINGWFSSGMHKVWPPPGNARKLYLGFHAACPKLLPPKSHRVVGCRDPRTALFCHRNGQEAWMSYCPTLTLTRPEVPRDDSVLLVDLNNPQIERLPKDISSVGKRISNIIDSRTPDRAGEVSKRLDLYARARWVVTRRLHVTLACVAFGTPVVLMKPDESESRYCGYLHLPWNVTNAPWCNPHPRVNQETINAMTLPLRMAVKHFIES